PRYWSEFACTSDLHTNVFHFRDTAARRVLVSDGPARSFSREAQAVLYTRGVHFDDDAVNLVRQLVTHGFALGDESEHLIDVACHGVMRIYLEARVLERS